MEKTTRGNEGNTYDDYFNRFTAHAPPYIDAILDCILEETPKEVGSRKDGVMCDSELRI